MFKFLLILQMLIAAGLVAVILMQRSEGGGLGVSNSSAGLMTARGAADFLTRATAILATLFVALSIGLAALASIQTAPTQIDPNLARRSPVQPTGAAPLGRNDVPLAADPLAGAATEAARKGAAQTPPANQQVPLAK
jgi:preprotein translocase subunit SecG